QQDDLHASCRRGPCRRARLQGEASASPRQRECILVGGELAARRRLVRGVLAHPHGKASPSVSECTASASPVFHGTWASAGRILDRLQDRLLVLRLCLVGLEGVEMVAGPLGGSRRGGGALRRDDG